MHPKIKIVGGLVLGASLLISGPSHGLHLPQTGKLDRCEVSLEANMQLTEDFIELRQGEQSLRIEGDALWVNDQVARLNEPALADAYEGHLRQFHQQLSHTSLEAVDISFSALQLSLSELFGRRTAEALLDDLKPFRQELEREFRGDSLELETLDERMEAAVEELLEDSKRELTWASMRLITKTLFLGTERIKQQADDIQQSVEKYVEQRLANMEGEIQGMCKDLKALHALESRLNADLLQDDAIRFLRML